MKKLVALVFMAILLQSGLTMAEELAPGFDACMDKAGSTAESKECFGKAFLYWDKQLNANFKKLPKACEEAPDPEACKARAIKAQKLWIQYKEAMAEALYDLGGGGSIAGLNVDSFTAEETKKQAKLLAPGE